MTTIRATVPTTTPWKTAKLFQAVLAADRGFASTLDRQGDDYLVTASDGQAILFKQEK